MFTILTEKKKIENNKVILLGDLKYGRTVHSLAYALSLFGAELTFVSPETLKMPKEVVNECKDLGAEPSYTSNLEKAIKDADVLYATRIQKERFPDAEEYNRVVGTYMIDNSLLKYAKEDLIIMHPLPRVDELAHDLTPLLALLGLGEIDVGRHRALKGRGAEHGGTQNHRDPDHILSFHVDRAP